MFKYDSTFVLCTAITISLIVHTFDCLIEDDPEIPFGCGDEGDTMVEEWRLCDGVEDCPSGNDEEPFMCKSFTCHPEFPFKCPDNGRCLRNVSICDGAPHCLDFSDEAPEMCKTWECDPAVPFKCKSDGMCLRATAVCDGVHHCIDRGDEDPEMCKKSRHLKAKKHQEVPDQQVSSNENESKSSENVIDMSKLKNHPGYHPQEDIPYKI